MTGNLREFVVRWALSSSIAWVMVMLLNVFSPLTFAVVLFTCGFLNVYLLFD